MANVIPPLLIQLQLESDQIKKQLSGLTGEVQNFGKTVEKQGSFLEKFKSTFAGVFGANIGMQGLNMLKTTLQSSIADAQEYEKQIGQLNAAIVSTGNVAGLSVADLKAHASALEDISTVDENVILNSQAVLATFTQVRNVTGEGNDVFNQATAALLDMSARLGTDAPNAAIQLGKALNDPIKGVTALKRVGVVFTAAQKEQIDAMVKSGDVMGAQKIILAELNVEFGGSAKAVGDTFAGAVSKAKDKVADFTRDLIRNLQPILLNIGKAIGDLYNKFLKPLVKIVIDNKEAILLFVGVLTAAYVATKVYNVVMGVSKAIMTAVKVAQLLMAGGQLATIASTNGLAASMLRLNFIMSNNPIGLIVAGIALLVAGFVVAWNHSETFRKFVVAGAKMVLTYVAFMIRAWGELITTILKVVTGPLKLFLGVLSKLPGVGGAAKSGLEIINKGIAGVADFAEAAAGKVEGFKKTLDGLQDKKIKLPSFGKKADETGITEGAVAPKFQGENKDAKAQAKAALKELETTQKSADKIYKQIGDVIKASNKEQVDAADKKDTAITKINKAFAIKLGEIQKKRDETEAVATATHGQKIEDIKIKNAEEIIKITRQYGKKADDLRASAAKKTADLEEKLQEKITSLRQKAAEKATDLMEKAAEKQKSILQKGADDLKAAFAAGLKFNVSDTFEKLGGNVAGMIEALKTKLSGAKTLQINASKLAAAGYSQGFIQQIIDNGPELGNQISESLLSSTPEVQKELQNLYYGLEDITKNGVNSLAASLNNSLNFSSQEQMDAYQEVSDTLKTALAETQATLQTDIAVSMTEHAKNLTETQKELNNSLAENSRDMQEALNENLKNYNTQIAEADKDLKDALAEAKKDFESATAEATQNAADAIAAAIQNYNDAIDEIAAATKEKLTELDAQLTAMYAKIAQLGGTAVNPRAVALPGGGGITDSQNAARLAAQSKTPTVALTQNNYNTTADPNAIAAAAISAIKFGMSGSGKFMQVM